MKKLRARGKTSFVSQGMFPCMYCNEALRYETGKGWLHLSTGKIDKDNHKALPKRKKGSK